MDFPIQRTYLDYSNNTRQFSIYRHENPAWNGCILCAQELIKGAPGGYQFEVATDADNPTAALGLLHEKIQLGLSRRYAYINDNDVKMLSNALRGRIESGNLKVDGELLAYDQLIDLFNMHQGFDFELKFIDSCALPTD